MAEDRALLSGGKHSKSRCLGLGNASAGSRPSAEEISSSVEPILPHASPAVACPAWCARRRPQPLARERDLSRSPKRDQLIHAFLSSTVAHVSKYTWTPALLHLSRPIAVRPATIAKNGPSLASRPPRPNEGKGCRQSRRHSIAPEACRFPLCAI